MATHTFSPEHPHGPKVFETLTAGELQSSAMPATTTLPSNLTGEANAALEATMATMHTPMMAGIRYPDPDIAFVLGMIPHHQGAIDMARVQLRYGRDPVNRSFAKHLITEQQGEIDAMRAWLSTKGIEMPTPLATQDDAHPAH